MSFKLNSIRVKIVLIFILISAFQLMVMAIFAITQLKPYINNTYISHQSQLSDALFDQLTNQKLKIEDYMVNIIGDSDVQEFLEVANNTDKKFYSHGMTTNVRNKILSYIDYDNRINAIYLVDNKDLVYSNYFNKQIAEFIIENIDAAEKKKEKPIWDTNYSDKNILVYRTINNTTTDLTKKIGAIFLVIDSRMFTDILGSSGFYADHKYFLISKDNHLKVGEFNDLDYDYDYSDLKSFMENQNKYISNYIENDEWLLFTWINKDVVFHPINIILRILVIETICLLGVTVGLIVFLSGKITKPVARISKAMRQMGNGTMGIKIPVSGNDELSELAKTMNSMSTQIEELVSKIKEDERNLRLLELKAMQYQINPHFLYNALDSINMLARKNNDMLSSELITDLANYFRISLSHGQELIKISDEVKHAKLYLDIQRVRFTNQFQTEINIKEGLEEIKIIKFILQPLVENSFNHGLRNCSRYGCIWIDVFTDDALIIFRVKDNGVGIMPDKLEKLKIDINMEDMTVETLPLKSGFGLRNVNQRLKMFYGDEYGLNIESEWDEGTIITIKIPKNKVSL